MSKKRLINRIEVDTILKKYNIRLSKYNIDNEGRIDVEGDVEFRYTNLNYLPLKFGKVNGSFNCSGLTLQSLKGAPSYVKYDFRCENNALTSLKYGPKHVGGSYNCSNNKLETLTGCATEIGRDFVCKHNKLKSLHGSPIEFYGRFNCSHNLLTSFAGAPETFRGAIYANSNYLINLKGFLKFDGTIFIDPSASSINTGYVDHPKMKIEIRLQSKYGHEFMPRPILENHLFWDTILKYQRYYEIWTDDDQLHTDYFQMLLEDLKDGLL
ncbi:MAG: hypothetical protein ACI93P_001448 [bacterium]|jgi:hypothetical protein